MISTHIMGIIRHTALVYLIIVVIYYLCSTLKGILTLNFDCLRVSHNTDLPNIV